MARTNIKSKSKFGQLIGFSRVSRVGNMIAVSGTAPVGPDGKAMHVGDLYNQTKYCLEIIKSAIEEAGGKLSDVIRTRIFLKDIRRWEEAARAHSEIFRDIMPACSFIGIKELIDREWLVEIEADCVIDE